MCDTKKKVALIIPCFNEEKRLDIESFLSNENVFLYVFVNDGSTDNTLTILQDNFKGNHHILNLEKNIGKANAVRAGFLFIKHISEFEQLDSIGFLDADLSVSLEEVSKIILNKQIMFNYDSVWGSRIKKLGNNIERNIFRHILGRIFSTFVGISFNSNVYDSQCGFKLFKKELISNVFQEEFISNWIFDIEILNRIEKVNIFEYPLENWIEKKGSKLKIKHYLWTVIDFLKIYRKYKLGK